MNAPDIIRALKGQWHGTYGTARCPAHRDKTPSLSVSIGRDGCTLVHCHTGCSQQDVIAALTARGLWSGEASNLRPFTPKEQPEDPNRNIDFAKRIWAEAVPAKGTLVEVYLASRGITNPIPDALRFHKGLKHPDGGVWPAMVAHVDHGVTGESVAIHRTYLKADGTAKAPVPRPKMMLGRCRGGAVRLSEGIDGLAIGEGIETSLSVQQATGRPTWAALSSSGLKALDLPSTVRRVTVLADKDDAGEAAATEAGQRWIAAGIEVKIARPAPGCTGSNFSTAVIFRGVDQWSPTLIVDEGDTYLKDNAEMRGILNSGHNRRMAWVLRAEGEDFAPTRFSTWSPKVVALIGKLHPTLSSRSIHIELKRKMPTETVEGLRADRVSHLLPIRQKAMRWALDNAAKLTGYEPEMPDFLHGRAADNWRPLLAIADKAGGEWPKKARDVAKAFSSRESNDVFAIQLLSDVRDIFGEADEMQSEDIVAELVTMDDRQWPEWKNGRPITKAQMAKLLSTFEVKTKQVWANNKNLHGYEAQALKDAFERYLPSKEGSRGKQTTKPLEPLVSNELRGIRTASDIFGLADEKDSKTLSSNGSSGLAVQKPLERGNGHVCAHCHGHAEADNPINEAVVDVGVMLPLHINCLGPYFEQARGE